MMTEDEEAPPGARNTFQEDIIVKRRIVFLTLMLALLALPALAERVTIENWAPDSPAMASIVDFVAAAGDEADPGFIPVEDRVAVFDMDGTLIGERFPTYFNDWLYINRALYDDGYEAPEELKAFARAWEDKVLRGVPLENFSAKERELGPKLYAGLTAEEYARVVRRFKAKDVYGFSGMTYGEAYFQPMVSLVKYLRENDWSVYIVSATYRDAVRVMTEGVLDQYVPYDHVIGSDFTYVASGDTEGNSKAYDLTPEDELVIGDVLFQKNTRSNKAIMIQQEVGRVPVLAFGNSTGDFSMATYTLSNEKYGGRAYMLLCDDTERDYGNLKTAAKFKKSCESRGFRTISERDEFETLYTKGVRKSSAEDDYRLEQVVVLSRHNIRSPLSGSGSLLGDITPHDWFEWTSNPSELSLRGAMLETLMGQYFRLWLEDKGLFPENYRPGDGEVRFYANSKQRTLATARYFSAGLLPVAQIPVESHGAYDTMDPVFEPALHFVTDAYAADVTRQVAEMGGVAGLEGIHAGLLDAIGLLMEVTDMDQSEAYRAGTYGDLLGDGTTLSLEAGKEPSMTGPIKTATSVADALVLQYYEQPNAKKAAFGHALTEDQWRQIHGIVDTYSAMLFTAPLVSVNVAHPLLQEILDELNTEGRRFTFLCGHDANIASVLASLGVTDYLLPDTVEQKTPIGCKLVFEKWLSGDGEEYARLRLVYQTTDQLRNITPLSLDTPPASFDIGLPGLETSGNGFYRLDDVCAALQGAIDAYDDLIRTYGGTETVAAA